MKTYKLIDDPLCDIEGFDSYENCEDCPYFYECMEVKEDAEPVQAPTIDSFKAALKKVLEHWDEEVNFLPNFDEMATNGFSGVSRT